MEDPGDLAGKNAVQGLLTPTYQPDTSTPGGSKHEASEAFFSRRGRLLADCGAVGCKDKIVVFAALQPTRLSPAVIRIHSERTFLNKWYVGPGRGRQPRGLYAAPLAAFGLLALVRRVPVKR